ncbi:MAG: hypothetical protein IJI57_07710 [Flexilinea sp.]|nr:hypothetical protein [Flexilinea sp.]
MKKLILIFLYMLVQAFPVYAQDEYWSWGVQKNTPEEQQKINEDNDRFRNMLTPTKTPLSYRNKITWKCIDATSYDGNAYNDNKCTSSSGQIKYVSDSEAMRLDPKYKPGESGAWYYNNK